MSDTQQHQRATDNETSFNVNENSIIKIPLRNLIALVAAIVVSVLAYADNKVIIANLQNQIRMLEEKVAINEEFRIKWPKGELGQLPADVKQDMDISILYNEYEELKELMAKLDAKIERKVEKLEEM